MVSLVRFSKLEPEGPLLSQPPGTTAALGVSGALSVSRTKLISDRQADKLIVHQNQSSGSEKPGVISLLEIFLGYARTDTPAPACARGNQ